MNRRKYKGFAPLIVLTIAVVGTVRAVGDFEISRSTIDDGGAMLSTAGDFELSGTIGQPDAGVLTGGEFTLTGGFWFETPLGDCNDTGCVNLLDYDDFEFCLRGPEGGLIGAWCSCFDFDNDVDVDLTDLARFQQSFTGG